MYHHYLIHQITVESTRAGGAPLNLTFTIECNETGVVYDNTTTVENINIMTKITQNRSVPVPLYNHCSFIINVSNCTGTSELFRKSFSKCTCTCIKLINLSPTDTGTPPSPPISTAPSPTNPPTSHGNNLTK